MIAKLLRKLRKKPSDNLADPSYLADITGTSPDMGLGDYLEETGQLQALPGYVQDRYQEAVEAQAEGVHGYLCNLDKESARGQKNSCAQSKAWNQYSQDIARANSPYILKFELVGNFPFRHEVAKHSIAIPKPATRAGKNLKGVDGRFQRIKPRQQRQRYHTAKVITTPSEAEKAEAGQFESSVNGDNGRTIGQRALFYDRNGNPLRGTGAIARAGKEAGMSASTATLNQSTGSAAGATPTAAPPLKVANHPNKKRAGQTTDKGGGLGGLAAIGLMGAAMAALLPMHFVTSAITFLNSVITFFTTTRNAIDTYTAIVDALLGLFGMRGATKGFKGFINGLIDNAFGKENIAYAKATFASTLNSVATGVKLAEKIQQSRAQTDNKIDDLALGLGTVNNSLKEAGLVPPDSPFMQSSQSIDQFVKDRTTGEGVDQNLKDNIYKLTEELKTHEEAEKELKEEAETQRKAKVKRDKQIDDTARLGAGLKQNAESIQPG
jgi:hypothetical protein